MADSSLLPGELLAGTSCADNLIMVLRETNIELQLLHEEAKYWRTSLYLTQSLPKEQNPIVQQMVRPCLDCERTFIDEVNTNNTNNSSMLAPGLSTGACSNAVSDSTHCIDGDFLHHFTEDVVMKSIPVQSPPQRLQSTCGEHGVEQQPPLPEKLMKSPNTVPSLLPNGESPMSNVRAQRHKLHPSVTTLIIRFIPPKASQDDLMALWPPTWGYNFFHLPHSPKQRRTVGYMFINFISNEAASLFYNQWEGHVFTSQSRTRTLSIHAAHVQGFWPIVEHLRRQGICQMRNDRYLPALFHGVDRICFRAVLRADNFGQACR